MYGDHWIDTAELDGWCISIEKVVGGFLWLGFSETEPWKMLCISSDKTTIFDCDSGTVTETDCAYDEDALFTLCEDLNDEQFPNNSPRSVTFEVFHFEISGIFDKDEQSENIPFKLLTLEISHLEISGRVNNEEHPLNKLCIYLILFVFHFEISGSHINDEQSENIPLISFTLDIFHIEISGKVVNDLQL